MKSTPEDPETEPQEPLPTGEESSALSRQGRRFEERYMDILQNIEFGIVCVYDENPQMEDWQALAAIEALLAAYQAEDKGRQHRPPTLDALSEQVYTSVRAMCEWRLGRNILREEDGTPSDFQPSPITLKEMIDCLKRVRKSINHWTRAGGRQGYLTFVQQYFP